MRPVWVMLAGALAVVGCDREAQSERKRPEGAAPEHRNGFGREKKRLAAFPAEPSPRTTLPPTPTPEPTFTPVPESDPGPPPAGDCALDIDEDGFFRRELLDGTRYIGFLPPGYSGEPTRLFVGLHGCGEDAEGFAEWAVNPTATRTSQEHIGISVEDGAGGGCWSEGEIPFVLHAIEDVSRCVYVHQKKIVVGGYSSGGELAYVIGLTHASRFAGILIENSSLSRAGDAEDLIDGASRQLPIAHIAHTGDSAYSIESVREDWDLLRAAGFPLDAKEVDGDHDGATEDWSQWLLPNLAEWESP